MLNKIAVLQNQVTQGHIDVGFVTNQTFLMALMPEFLQVRIDQKSGLLSACVFAVAYKVGS